jgi:hypothetical protein
LVAGSSPAAPTKKKAYRKMGFFLGQRVGGLDEKCAKAPMKLLLPSENKSSYSSFCSTLCHQAVEVIVEKPIILYNM